MTHPTIPGDPMTQPNPHSVEGLVKSLRGMQFRADYALGYIEAAVNEVGAPDGRKVATVRNVLVALHQVGAEGEDPTGLTYGRDPEADPHPDAGREHDGPGLDCRRCSSEGFEGVRHAEAH